jgi:hypothetical protein
LANEEDFVSLERVVGGRKEGGVVDRRGHSAADDDVVSIGGFGFNARMSGYRTFRSRRRKRLFFSLVPTGTLKSICKESGSHSSRKVTAASIRAALDSGPRAAIIAAANSTNGDFGVEGHWQEDVGPPPHADPTHSHLEEQPPAPWPRR